jgi:hypothetical protein
MNGRERGIDVQRGAQTGRKRKKGDDEKSRISHAPATPLFTNITEPNRERSIRPTAQKGTGNQKGIPWTSGDGEAPAMTDTTTFKDHLIQLGDTAKPTQ